MEAAVKAEVLVVGEALIDVVMSGGGTAEHVGGSPANVAYGLARLGVRTAILTAIGNDERGRLIRRHLESAGVELLPDSVTAWPTSSATARLDAGGSASYDFDIRWELPRTDTVEGSHLHVGSISAFLEPGGSTVVDMVRSWAGGGFVSFDPNIRPALVGEPDGARARFRAIAAHADLIKLSDEDAAWLFPGDSLDDVIGRILDEGAQLVAVTRGAEGSRLATPHDRVDVAARTVRVVDTIGAGDAFMASLIASARGIDLSDIPLSTLEWIGARAAAASGVTVSRSGAALPSAEELDLAFTDGA